MDAAMLTLGVLAVAAILFATEIIPLAVTAMGAAISLGLLGVLTPTQVFSGLSNSTVVLFAGMFVIGAAMSRRSSWRSPSRRTSAVRSRWSARLRTSS